jgi:AraC family transcriptional regulator
LNAAATAERYLTRFREVLGYIDTHLQDELCVERLSDVVGFSKYHFHRQFTALFGIGVFRYVQLNRLKRAAYRLAFREQAPILDIALDAGYEGPEAFARAFRKSVGQSPSEFRKQPRWLPWHATYRPLRDLRTTHMKPHHHADEVSLVEFPETRVAALEHRGDPLHLGDSIRRFIEWRRQNRLPPRVSATFNIAYDDPEGVVPADFRMDLCAATENPIVPNSQGVVAKVIPGGRCALLRHLGSEDTLGGTIRYLYSHWLPRSGAEPRDFPLFLQRIVFFPEVPEHEAITDVFLPLK